MKKLVIASALLAVSWERSAPAQAGNIDPAQKTAWAENAGWLDMRPAGGGVTVGATFLSGYAWQENVGWIKLGSDAGGPYSNTSATNWGVNRSGASLSGYAWAENAGWIRFDPPGGGVSIDPTTLVISGFAWSENLGWISLRGGSGGTVYGVAVVPNALAAAEVPAATPLGLLALAAGLGLIGARRLSQGP